MRGVRFHFQIGSKFFRIFFSNDTHEIFKLLFKQLLPEAGILAEFSFPTFTFFIRKIEQGDCKAA